MNLTVFKYGKILKRNLYTIDKNNKTIHTKEDELLIEIRNANGWTITVGDGCHIRTDSPCSIISGDFCTFDTEWNCNFTTGKKCSFIVNRDCSFKVETNCSFIICNGFDRIQTEGMCTILTEDGGIYIEEPIVLYGDRHGNIYYTDSKLSRDKYLMSKELMK